MAVLTRWQTIHVVMYSHTPIYVADTADYSHQMSVFNTRYHTAKHCVPCQLQFSGDI